jgi:bacterial/archaeal transporter family-2 protein
MSVSLWIWSLLAGGVLALQVGMNGVLKTTTGSPLIAALINFLVGTLLLAMAAIATRAPWPAMGAMRAVPAWAWFGGFCGSLYVATVSFTGPKLGATTVLALTLLGQSIVSLLVDHYGLVGLPAHPVTLARVLGVLLLLGGALLIAR